MDHPDVLLQPPRDPQLNGTILQLKCLYLAAKSHSSSGTNGLSTPTRCLTSHRQRSTLAPTTSSDEPSFFPQTTHKALAAHQQPPKCPFPSLKQSKVSHQNSTPLSTTMAFSTLLPSRLNIGTRTNSSSYFSLRARAPLSNHPLHTILVSTPFYSPVKTSIASTTARRHGSPGVYRPHFPEKPTMNVILSS